MTPTATRQRRPSVAKRLRAAHAAMVSPGTRGTVECPVRDEPVPVGECATCPQLVARRTFADAGASVTVVFCRPSRR